MDNIKLAERLFPEITATPEDIEKEFPKRAVRQVSGAHARLSVGFSRPEL